MVKYRIRWHDRFLDRVFEFAGRRYRCFSDDMAAIRFLERLELDRQAPDLDEGIPPTLLGMRDEFRRLIADQPIAGLVCSLAHGSADTRRLAIWLLGCCGNSSAIPALRVFAAVPRRDIRLAVVRALRRLRARAELLEIARRDPDPWIRKFALASTKRSFATQMEQFLRTDVSEIEADAPATIRMPLVWEVHELVGRQPKSGDVMRAILERIRRLLRGNGFGKAGG